MIELDSKVARLYGDDILRQASDIMEFYGLRDADLEIRDSGALPFVIAARLEAAIHLVLEDSREWLLPLQPANMQSTARDLRRCSRLYLPGNTPKLMLNAGLHAPDGLILDLEDAVAPDKKHEARFLVRNALRSLDFMGTERMVRINQVPLGLQDLDFVVPHGVNLILLPKCESAEQVHQVNERIETLLKGCGQQRAIWIMPIVESALGVVRAFEIASSAPNVVAMAIGLEDYTADLGTRRSPDGRESFYARSAVVNACRAAGIQPIDSVFSDVSDMEALRRNVLESKALGFDGMGCIHPRQVAVIHETFAPEKAEIDKAKKIVRAFEDARSRGLGVVAIGSKMIDAPVVKRALRTIATAVSAGKLNQNWRDEDENR